MCIKCFLFYQLSMTLPEQVCDPLVGPNPPLENHCNNECSIESFILETYPVALYLSLYFLQIAFRKFFFFPDTLPDFCQCCGSSGDQRYHIAIFAPLHRTMSDQSRCLAAWTAHTLMGRTGMLLRGPDWWAFLLLAVSQAPSQQTTDSDTCIKHEAVGQCTKRNTRGAPWIQMLRESIGW